MAKGHQGKVAVITGAANGIGQAFARRLAEEGVDVAIADVAAADETVRMVEAAGRRALAVDCDVASPASVAALAKEVDQRFGRCDILVNCAGIFPQQPFDAMTYADWRRLMAVNLDGVFLVTSAFVPGMKRDQWGRIVNMASSTFSTVTSGFAHYIASKGGVIGLTRALATELGPHGVTVNAICPGMFGTARLSELWEARARKAGTSVEEERTKAIKGIPAGRLGEPAELGAFVAYLASEPAAFITGQAFRIDGGAGRAI
jgi:NAD(P)-dependent dehydrogenase (short-subunit alcohol dehydrogenase family)